MINWCHLIFAILDFLNLFKTYKIIKKELKTFIKLSVTGEEEYYVLCDGTNIHVTMLLTSHMNFSFKLIIRALLVN